MADIQRLKENLEERGFRGAVTDAVIAAYEKTIKLREG